MEKSQVVASLVSDLKGTEESVDAAIIRATALVQGLVGARAALGLSPVVAAGSQAKAMAAIAALGAAREAVVSCHEEMAKDHRRLGWGAYAVGQLDKYPDGDGKPIPKPRGHLKAV
jgi:hypothetical protein